MVETGSVFENMRIVQQKRIGIKIFREIKGGNSMNDKTRYEIIKNRELLKGYHAADAGAEETDQRQKAPSIPCLQEKGEPIPFRSPRTMRLFPFPEPSWR